MLLGLLVRDSETDALWICSDQHQACSLIQFEHQVHVLHGLSSCTLNEIIQGRKDYELVPSHRETDIAEICGLNPINIWRSFYESYEKGVAIKLAEDFVNLAFCNL